MMDDRRVAIMSKGRYSGAWIIICLAAAQIDTFWYEASGSYRLLSGARPRIQLGRF